MKPKIAAEDPESLLENRILTRATHSRQANSADASSTDISSDISSDIPSPEASEEATTLNLHMATLEEPIEEHLDALDEADTGELTDLDAGFDKQTIPDIVIGRLPVYLRTLKLLAAEGQEVASSQELGERLGISSAQIRKDLSHFGEFGKQGTGYNVAYLCRQLEKILKVDCIWPVVLVGAGYLGHALASYNGFEHRGFRIVAVFDSDARKIGTEMGNGVVIEPLDAITATVRQYKCQIAIIAVPAEAAQPVANELIEAGIKSILCYAPITLTVPKHIRVEYIDPVIHFQHMTFYLDKSCIDG